MDKILVYNAQTKKYTYEELTDFKSPESMEEHKGGYNGGIHKTKLPHRIYFRTRARRLRDCITEIIRIDRVINNYKKNRNKCR